MTILSVIIPTFNRRQLLARCLHSLLAQSLGEPHEVIVVDDGSTDGTKEELSRLAGEESRVIVLRQDHAGPAAARNRGVCRAQGKYVFFTGDDIIAPPDLLRQHLKMLSAGPGRGVVGFTDWGPECGESRFRKYLLEAGHQFDYRGLSENSRVSWKKFYCSNVSLERRWLEIERFDETFTFPSYEDLELGYRLCRKGLKLFFNRQALAFHSHPVEEEEFYAKARRNGESRVRFLRKHGKPGELGLFLCRARGAVSLLKSAKAYRGPLPEHWRWKMNILYHTGLGALAAQKLAGQPPQKQV